MRSCWWKRLNCNLQPSESGQQMEPPQNKSEIITKFEVRIRQ